MNELLSVKGVASLRTLLAAYRKAGIKMHNAIDGGAGWGFYLKDMLDHINGRVYAFEPFPGNHRFFADCDSRVVLLKEALADERKRMAFRVDSAVTENSEWGRQGMAGYSSVGRLVEQARPGDFTVQCVRADEAIPKPYDISFIKLDLQGGELNALKGMSAFLQSVPLMWIEYSGQAGLLDYITDQGFAAFDTEYFFIGSPSASAREIFDVSIENYTLSNGHRAWFGFKKKPWRHYESELAQFRASFKLVQTDLACVHRARLEDFLRAATLISPTPIAERFPFGVRT